MNKRKKILAPAFFVTLGSAIIYIAGIGGLYQYIISLSFYATISYLIVRTWRYIRKKEALVLTDFLFHFFYKLSIFVSILILCIGSFAAYQNILSPALFPLYTISNGEQIIKFQTMSHIASPSFYAYVQSKINDSKKQDFVLYYEGVRPGSEASTDEFNKALGINFTPDLYQNFSKLYGVVAQDNQDFLNIINNKDYNIDLTLDEVVELYRKKTLSQQSTSTSGEETEVLDINTEIITSLSQLSEEQLHILRFINQSILNFMMKHSGLRDMMIESLGNQDIFSVILDERNEYLVEEIKRRNDNKIHIIYGLLHFKGVLDLLQLDDARWRIIETEYVQVITQFER